MRRIALVFAVSCLAGFSFGACSGGTDDTKTDAGTTTTDGGATTTDAGTTTTTDGGDSCPDKCAYDCSNDCACVFNHDCNVGWRCKEGTNPDNGVCEKGTRGTKTYEQECTDAFDCVSGKCLFETETATKARCSKGCAPDEGGASACLGSTYFKTCDDTLYFCKPTPAN